MQRQERVILHSDCNCFYASVEELHHPELHGLPIAVAGDPENRHGIILAKNQLAKKQGVKTAEAIWEAKQKSSGLVIIPPNYPLYQKFSRMAREIYYSYTDRVEPFGLDESWCDVTGSVHLFGSGEEIAREIRQRIKRELGITVSIGVSWNKIFAKFGSDYKKPDALDKTMDSLRHRFGNNSVRRAITLGDTMSELDPKRDNVIHPVGYF